MVCVRACVCVHAKKILGYRVPILSICLSICYLHPTRVSTQTSRFVLISMFWYTISRPEPKP